MMRIKSLTFKNNKTGWHVDNLEFGMLTLLVGASGVGKTQILRALQRLSGIARGFSYNGIEWNVQFLLDGKRYDWSGSFETADVEDQLDVTKDYLYDITKETLTIDGVLVVDRDENRLLFQGMETIKLDKQKSVIELLKEEANIEPINKAFRKISILSSEREGILVSPIKNDSSAVMTIRDIKQSSKHHSIEKLFLLKKNNLPEFDEICNAFKSIFPIIEEVNFTTGTFWDDRTFPILEIKEHGMDSWILRSDISNGMIRTLNMLTTFFLAEDGDVILIDEFENGLGVNCIDDLAEMIISPETNVQVIMTSHHPYIINAIPFKNWKIVTRQKTGVKAYSANELSIGEFSKHDAFIQLVQSEAYRKGVL